MFEKKFTYRVGPGLRDAFYASDDLSDLVDQIVRAERESGFGAAILSGRGVLTVVRSNVTHFMATSSLKEAVGRARQDHVARAGTLAGDRWGFAPSRHDRDVVFAPTVRELANAVAGKYVGGLSIHAEDGEVEEAVEDVCNGRLYHGGREVQFDEPMRDGGRRVFECATLWFEAVGRAVRCAKVFDDQIRQTMLDNAHEVIQYVIDTRDHVGVVVRVEKNALDDHGARRDLVAVVDVGDAHRRLAVVPSARDRMKDRVASVVSLVGREVEFADAPGGYVLDVVPAHLRDMSAAFLSRELTSEEVTR